MKTDKYVGLDVHKTDSQIVIADEGRNGEVRHHGKISSDLHAMERLVTKIGGPGITRHFAYETGVPEKGANLDPFWLFPTRPRHEPIAYPHRGDHRRPRPRTRAALPDSQ